MKKLALLLFFAVPLFAEGDDALTKRIRRLAGPQLAFAEVHSRHASGRPRLVVAGTDQGELDAEGELLLIRFPDKASGAGNVVHRMKLEAGVVELQPIRLVDARDYAVSLRVKHDWGVVVRVAGEKLVQITDDLPDSIVDLDGDGVPEIVVGLVPGAGTCDRRGHPQIQRWNGREYEGNGKRYAVMAIARVGEEPFETGFEALDYDPQDASKPPHDHLLRVYKQPGVESVEVKVDDEPAITTKPIALENDCHTIWASAKGKPGAQAWIFLEERP